MAICTLCQRAVNDADVNTSGRCVDCAGQPAAEARRSRAGRRAEDAEADAEVDDEGHAHAADEDDKDED
jgi:hypothetical protein